MFEVANHKKTSAVLAVLLCVPLLLVIWFSVQLATGSAEFKGISEARIVLPDGSELQLQEETDVSFYSDMLRNASSVQEALRSLDAETPAILYLDNTAYRLYPSAQSISGCMAVTSDGRVLLLTQEDAKTLLMRPEMEYLYAANRLPTLTVLSGDDTYSVLPQEFNWQYRKPDDQYHPDTTTELATELPVCNLFAQQLNDLSFSVNPSHYELKVYLLQNGTDGLPLENVTSLAGLQFQQDTTVRVEVSAKWSQASNNQQYGEAKFAFYALYDVPAVVELIGGNTAATVKPGDFLLLRANYTNPQEKLAVRAEFDSENLQFYYDENTQCSYAAIPVGRKIEAGEYRLYATAGSNETIFTVTVTDPGDAEMLTYQVSQEQYEQLLSPEKLAELEQTLHELRLASDGVPHLNADLAFGVPTTGKVVQSYGANVSFVCPEVSDPRLNTLEGAVYATDSKSTVLAIQSGVCVYAGELGAAGQTVVLDHGCGIFSYYFHLTNVQVSVGDNVMRSGQIGTMGKEATGYTDGKNRMQCALSVGDSYVRLP